MHRPILGWEARNPVRRPPLEVELVTVSAPTLFEGPLAIRIVPVLLIFYACERIEPLAPFAEFLTQYVPQSEEE